MEKKSNSNTLIVALLGVLIVAVVGVGGYFIARDVISRNDTQSSQPSHADSGGGTEKKNDESKQTTPDNSASEEAVVDEIEAGITYAEVRGNDFYVEVQVNGQVTGRCDISVMPTNGTQGHQDDDDLEIRNKVSICDEDFSLKGMNPGEHNCSRLFGIGGFK